MGVEHSQHGSEFRLHGFDTSHLALIPVEQRTHLICAEARNIAHQLAVQPAFARSGFDPHTCRQVVNYVLQQADEPKALHKFVRVGDNRASVWTASVQVLPHQEPKLVDFSLYSELVQGNVAIMGMSYASDHVVQDVRIRDPKYGTLRAFVYNRGENGQPIGRDYSVVFHHPGANDKAARIELGSTAISGSELIRGLKGDEQLTVKRCNEGVFLSRLCQEGPPTIVDLSHACFAAFYILQQAQTKIGTFL